MKPIVRRAALSGRVYVVTRWHPDRGALVADETHDVTAQVAPLLGEAWTAGFNACNAAGAWRHHPQPVRPRQEHPVRTERLTAADLLALLNNPQRPSVWNVTIARDVWPRTLDGAGLAVVDNGDGRVRIDFVSSMYSGLYSTPYIDSEWVDPSQPLDVAFTS